MELEATIEKDIFTQSLEILQNNIPNVITTIIASRTFNTKVIISILFSPIFINYINHKLNKIKKEKLEKEYIIYLDEYNTRQKISLYFSKHITSKAINNKECNSDRLEISSNDKIKMINNRYVPMYIIIENIRYDFIFVPNSNKSYLKGPTRESILKLINLINNNTDECNKKVYTTITGNSHNSSLKSKYFPLTFDDIFLSKKSQIKNNIDIFKNSKSKYYKTKNAYKYTILTHGSSGTGKTSIANVLATYLGYELYKIKCDVCNDFGWIEQKIAELNKAVVLIDEIDRVINYLNETTYSETLENKITTTKTKNGIQFINSLMKMLESQEFDEIIIIFTTNQTPDKFDPALFRPGRIDYVEEFLKCDDDQFRKIFQYYTETKVPDDFIFPEYKFSQSDIVHKFCKPYSETPNKILEMILQQN